MKKRQLPLFLSNIVCIFVAICGYIMKLTISKSKNATLYYVQKSYRTESGKSSTRTVERLGTIEEVEARFGKENPMEAVKAYIHELTKADKELRRDVVVKFSQSTLIKSDTQRCFNGGYLFLQKVYHDLGLDKICKAIEKKHKNEYDLNEILSMLLYTRVLYPGSKRSSLEDKFCEKFGISKVVVCTDGGLASYENRLNDHVGERAFITVQSLKKIEKHLQEWALKTTGWKLVNFQGKNGPELSEIEYDLTQLDSQKYADALFCRERWIKTRLSKTGEELEQRLIVTFSFKYRDYLRHTREKQIARANEIIDKRAAGKLGKSQNDPKRFIKQESCTEDGELAGIKTFSLNQEMIEQEERFDGFYGICTDLEDNAAEIIKMNGGRWIIEDCFRITKTEFEARPVFLQRDDRIKAHFLTCFLALLLYKYLEKKVNQGGKHFSPAQIIDTLKDMNFIAVSGEGYIPTYTRGDLTNNLHGSAGFRTDTQIISKQRMKSIIGESKKSAKKD